MSTSDVAPVRTPAIAAALAGSALVVPWTLLAMGIERFRSLDTTTIGGDGELFGWYIWLPVALVVGWAAGPLLVMHHNRGSVPERVRVLTLVVAGVFVGAVAALTLYGLANGHPASVLLAMAYLAPPVALAKLRHT